MRIYAMNRGGLSVFGGHYDPHRNEAIVLARDDVETVAVTIEYPSAPTSPSAGASSVTCSSIATNGNKLTFTLSSMNDGGYVDISATVGGAVRKVRIRARTSQYPDLYESGGEAA